MEITDQKLLKPCIKCGAVDRNKYGACRPCGRAATASWAIKNPDKRRKQLKTWQQANPEKNKIACSKWAASNPDAVKKKNANWSLKNKDVRKINDALRYLNNTEKCKEIAKAWKTANSDRVKKYAAGRYLINPEQRKLTAEKWKRANADEIKEKARERRQQNPESVRISSHNRRAKKKEVGGRLSVGISKKLFKLQKGKCACCGDSLGDNYHMDHIMPLALGGSNTDGNIQLLKQKCNNQKAAKHPIDFMQQRGFLL